MGVVINGATYRVGTAALSRTYRKEYKYKVVTEDGVSHSELRAVYGDFSLSLGNIDSAAYDAILAALLQSGTVTVTLPTGRAGENTYIGTFDGISDELVTQENGENFWDNLTLQFTGTVPLEEGQL